MNEYTFLVEEKSPTNEIFEVLFKNELIGIHTAKRTYKKVEKEQKPKFDITKPIRLVGRKNKCLLIYSDMYLAEYPAFRYVVGIKGYYLNGSECLDIYTAKGKSKNIDIDLENIPEDELEKENV